MLVDDRPGGLGLEGDPTGQHLVQDHAQGVDVGAMVNGLALGLFRGHVLWSPNDGHGLDPLGALKSFSDAKVRQHRAPILLQQNVRGLDVAVNNPISVGIVQRRAHLVHYRQDEIRRQWLTRRGFQTIFQGSAIYKFHGDIMVAMLLASIVHMNDVRMVQSGR